jgi:hypothetical protein
MDPPAISTGGERISGSFQLPLSYAYEEGLFQLIAGGIDTAAGAGPYTHTIALADRLRFGTLVYYWEDFKGVRYQLLMANACITQLTITQEAQQRPTVTANWVAQTFTASVPGAAPTLSTLEYPDWDDATCTVGAACLVNRSFSLDISQPVTEDDYGICSADKPDVVFIGRAGQRTVTLTVDAGLDSETEGWLKAAGTAIATNSLVWDNGAATTANRKITITLSNLYVTPTDTQRGTFGKLNASFSFLAVGPTPFAIVTTNAITVAEPPAP